MRLRAFLFLGCLFWVAGCYESRSPELRPHASESGPVENDASRSVPRGSPDSDCPILLPTESFTEDAAALSLRRTPFFTIQLPPEWTIDKLPRKEDDRYAEFRIVSPPDINVFMVVVATDKPRFIQCFCAPWEKYKHYEQDGIKYADLTMTIGRSEIRTLKAVGRKYGTDVHLDYKSFDHELLDRIIESIRPL